MMERIAIVAALLLAAGLGLGCEQSHSQASSGSNWLTCETVEDCDDPRAVSCGGDGYCRDDDGDRIPVPDDADEMIIPDAGRSADATVAPPQELCAWGVDEMLEEVDATASDRVNCGGVNERREELLAASFACFSDAVAAGQAVQLTVNRCIDCSIPTTYVATEDAEFFALLMESDQFGDNDREARVAACSAVELEGEASQLRVVCTDEAELYQCSEPLSIERTVAPSPPERPRKVLDVAEDGSEAVTLHLYVSNQSFETPLVDIDVRLDDTPVVTGDFDVEDQHNWIQFDIAVPAASFELFADSSDADAEIYETIEVPGERWAVLELWQDSSTSAAYFTVSIQDTPVAFQ